MVFYILSGKNGITSFTYKELELLEKSKVKFVLLFTQLRASNIQPKDDWDYIVVSRSGVLRAILRGFIKIILKKAFFESIRTGEMVSFLIAYYFYNRYPEPSGANVHVQMGDHKLKLGYYLKRLSPGSILSTTIHAHELYAEYRYSNMERYRHLINSCDRIFTVSRYNKDILRNELLVPENKIEIMYLYPSFQAEGFNTKKRILMVGNWERKKGYEDILDVLGDLTRDDFVVFIAGKAVNPEVDLDLSSMIREMSLESKVKLLGQVDKTVLEILFNYCDLFILPSTTEYFSDGRPREREGIPVALMEAMSFGMPVISSRHAGIPELVEEYLFDEGNKIQLKETLLHCLNKVEEVKEKGLKNKEIISQSFSFRNSEALSKFFLERSR